MLRREKEEVAPSTSSDSTLTTTKKNKKWMNKRRFSDAQIKLMESMFETESKLEQNAKIQLAKELDLQPRQVAIWFQNRRARWKSKQLERDYKLLKANYDALATQYESIKKEKQMLLMQLQKHNNLQRNPKDEGRPIALSLDGSSTDGEPEQKPALSFVESDLRIPVCSDDENNHNMYLGETEDVNLMSIMDPTDPMLPSPGNWPTFDPDNDLNQSCSTSQWWEFWQ